MFAPHLQNLLLPHLEGKTRFPSAQRQFTPSPLCEMGSGWPCCPRHSWEIARAVLLPKGWDNSCH